MTKPRLLIVGDFVKHSGFARVNEALSWHLREQWDIGVLALNYKGDACPQQLMYRLYPAHLGGDLHGIGRIADVVRVERPDAILLVNDPFIAGAYLEALGDDHPPCVLYTPVDGTSLMRQHGESLNGFDQVIAYTQFGANVLAHAGCTAPMAIIPHGIDLELFQPVPQADARRVTGMPADTYAVLILDRNQPRKRLDIAFEAFARFAEGKPETVKLVYLGAMIDAGWDIEAMAEDLCIADRLVKVARDVRPLAGIHHQQLKYVYSMCDVKLSTTSGEGWGLTTMEAMACGLANIVPDFAALGEWAKSACYTMPAPVKLRHAEINTIGRVPLVADVVTALQSAYDYPQARAMVAQRGLELVQKECYRWPVIAEQFDALLQSAVGSRQSAVAQPEAMFVEELVAA